MSDPNVRAIGHVKDINGGAVVVGVDYDAVTISAVINPATLERAQAEEFAQLFVAACWEAARCGTETGLIG